MCLLRLRATASGMTPLRIFFPLSLVPVCLMCLILLAMPSAEAWAESFWETVVSFLGISATPSQLKGPDDEIKAGEIWVIHLDRKTPSQITTAGGYRSPVFMPGDTQILALRGQTLVRISVVGGEPERLLTVPGIIKIVGFHTKDHDKVLMLTQSEADRLMVGLISLQSGQVIPLSYDRQSDIDQRLLSHLQEWERVYDRTAVYVQRETKPGPAGPMEWTDVFLKQGGHEPVNVSQCNEANCGQPSLSHDGRQVVFVKAEP